MLVFLIPTFINKIRLFHSMIFKDERFIPLEDREPVDEGDDFEMEEDMMESLSTDKKKGKFTLYMAS